LIKHQLLTLFLVLFRTTISIVLHGQTKSFLAELGKLIKISINILGLLLMLSASSTFADEEVAPYAWEVKSANGTYLFKMSPPDIDYKHSKFIEKKLASTIVYKLTESGKQVEIWKAQGWYHFEGMISPDGRYFVGFGPWASDFENHSDLAIAFYDRGKLIKSYKVNQLIKNMEALEYSVSHYRWRPDKQTKPNGFYDKVFHMVMIDKTAYDFNFTTGDIIRTDIDSKAKGSAVIDAELRQKDKELGISLFQASHLKEKLSPYFTFSRITSSNNCIIYGCSVRGQLWDARLTPKEDFKHDTSINLITSVDNSGQIKLTITAQEILDAITQVYAHPFVAERFSKGAEGIRLRMQGEYLHWNTPELKKFLQATKGSVPADSDLKYWGYFIIDAKDPRYTGIYFNYKTGELMYEERTKPFRLILVDKKGTHKNAKGSHN